MKLNTDAKTALRNADVSQAAWARQWFPCNATPADLATEIGRPVWLGDACGCPDDRCIGYHHDDNEDCGCLPALLANYASGQEIFAQAPAAGVQPSPYELSTEQIALVLDALEFAAKACRERADQPCVECGRALAGACDEHSGDLEKAADYEDLADEIREDGQ